MSDTPKLADEAKRLLDNGWTIALYKNGMDSYTAVALSQAAGGDVQDAVEASIADYDEEGEEWKTTGIVMTDDFEPSQVLYRITEKVFGNIA